MKRPPLPNVIWGFQDEQAPCTWCGTPTKEFRRTRGVEINPCCSDMCAKFEAAFRQPKRAPVMERQPEEAAA